MESRRVRLLLCAVAVTGLFTGAWACGSRTDVEVGEVAVEGGTRDGGQPGSDSERPPVDGGRPDDAFRPPLDSGSDILRPVDAADATPQCIRPDSGGPVTLATGQSPQALVLDDTYVYWENSTGSVVEWPLLGCPTKTLPTVLATNADAVSQLDELAVGNSLVYFADNLGNLDSCLRAGCGESPNVYWSNTGGVHGLVTDSNRLYSVMGDGLRAGPLVAELGELGSEGVTDSYGYALALSSIEVYFPSGATISATPICNVSSDPGCHLKYGDAAAPRRRTVCSSPTLMMGDVPAMVVADNYVYFTSDADRTSIYQCPSAGGGSPSVFATDVAPYGLATDGTSLYWTNYVASGAVASCALGATCSAPSTIASAQDQPHAMAVNSKSVYWTTITAVYEAAK